MRPLVLNVTIGPDLHHGEIPLTGREVGDLAHHGLLETSIDYWSQPGCPITEPRLRCPSAGWHDVVQALMARRRDNKARAQTAPGRLEAQTLTDRALLIQYGRRDQVERLDADVLPPAEVTAIARREIFAPLDGFRKRAGNARIKASELHHHAGCPSTEFSSGQYETLPDPRLDADAWKVYQAIRVACTTIRGNELAGYAPERVNIQTFDHVGWCPLCNGDKTVAPAAKVSVLWNGWTLVREYEL